MDYLGNRSPWKMTHTTGTYYLRYHGDAFHLDYLNTHFRKMTIRRIHNCARH